MPLCPPLRSPSPSLTGHGEHPLRMPHTEIKQLYRDITGRLLHPTLASENAGQVIAHSLLCPQRLGVRWLTGHPVLGWPSWGLPGWVPGWVRTSRRGSRRAGWPAWQRVPGSVREPEGILVCRGRQSHPCP